jgi:D-alanyl-D-alanine carboxypeptidase
MTQHSTSSDQTTTTATRQDRPELQQAIKALVDSGITGVTLRVNDEHGEWVGAAGVGEIGESALPSTEAHVRIASNTKTFTATAVLQLVAEGRIDLDAPLVGYLPEFDLDERVTTRMILRHTSGIFNFTGEVYEDGTIVPGVPMPYGAGWKEWLDNRFKTYTTRELVELALAKPARFEPGEGWSYSNTNYVLARLLIEKVTGHSLAEELQRRIIGPLGLTGTVVPDASPEIPEPHAHAYYRYEDDGRERTVDITRQNPSCISTGGDMISTTKDLHTFIAALLSGRLLPDDVLAEMCAPHPTGLPNMDYGLGVFVLTRDDGSTLISHNGGGFGHAALMYSTPDGRTTLTGSFNYVDDPALSLAAEFRGAQQQFVDLVFGDAKADE